MREATSSRVRPRAQEPATGASVPLTSRRNKFQDVEPLLFDAAACRARYGGVATPMVAGSATGGGGGVEHHVQYPSSEL
jgi:hypothetical protein